MKNFFKSLKYIFNPNFWIMLYPYSKEWDRTLLEAMANNKVELTNGDSLDRKIYAVKIGDRYVWIQNYPYGYAREVFLEKTITFSNGHKLDMFDFLSARPKRVRPSRSTIEKLKQKIKEEINI